MLYQNTVPGGSGHQTATLEDYIFAINRKRWVVLVCLLLATLAGWLFIGARTPQYQAEARVVVAPTPVGSINANLVAPTLEREVELLVSDQVATRAVEMLGTSQDPQELRDDVEADFLPDSDVIRVSLTSPNAEESAQVAAAFAAAYTEIRTDAQANYYDTRLDALQSQVDALEDEIDGFNATLSTLETERTRLLEAEASDSRTVALESNGLARQSAQVGLNAAVSQLRQVDNSYSTLEAERRTAAPAAAVIQQASVPSGPEGLPNSVFFVAFLTLGLLVGVAAAFVANRLDKRVTSDAAIQQALNASPLGRIPELGWRNRNGGVALTMLSPNRSVPVQRAREAFRGLRTSVLFLKRTENIDSIVITSHHASEGKSLVAANLAVALAMGGNRVGLISADMRRPTIDALFGLPESTGLSEFLDGTAESLHTVEPSEVPGLVIVPSGSIPRSPGELMGSPGFKQVITGMQEHVDVLIIDTPPVGAAADATVAAEHVDGVIMVVDVRDALPTELSRAKDEFDRSGARLVGTVLNHERTEQGGRFRRRNRYAYERDAND